MSLTKEPPRVREKLRDSCDTCAASKVRCSKGRPSCERCSDRQLPCHYSLCRRIGKRRATLDSQESSDSKNIGTHCAATDIRGLETQPQPNHDSIPITFGPPCLPPMLSDPKSDELKEDTFFPWACAPFVANSDPNQLIHSAANSDRCTDGYIDNYAGEFGEMLTPTSFDDTSCLGMGLDGESTPMMHENHTPPISLASACSSRSMQKPQDCMGLAINTLQNLHMSSSTWPLTIGSPGTTPSSLDSSTEQMLAMNRAVFDSISVILNCYHCLSAQLALILTLIVSELIVRYKAILIDVDGPGNVTMTEPGAKLYVGKQHSLPVAAVECKPEEPDKRKMRVQLVLRELRHVDRVVEQLAKHFGSENPSTRAVIGELSQMKTNRATSPLCEQLQTFLKNELQSVTKKTVQVL